MHWRPALQIGPDPAAFENLRRGRPSQRHHFMAIDRDNPSSVWSCVTRQRGRTPGPSARPSPPTCGRASIGTWQESRALDYAGLEPGGLSRLFRLDQGPARTCSAASTAAPCCARRLASHPPGRHIERADNTARILDVKYHVLLPAAEAVGGAVDYYQWAALLRSVASFSAYRHVYRDAITPARVAELLILNADLPRSLRACYANIGDNLDLLVGHRRPGMPPPGRRDLLVAALRPHRRGLRDRPARVP